MPLILRSCGVRFSFARDWGRLRAVRSSRDSGSGEFSRDLEFIWWCYLCWTTLLPAVGTGLSRLVAGSCWGLIDSVGSVGGPWWRGACWWPAPWLRLLECDYSVRRWIDWFHRLSPPPLQNGPGAFGRRVANYCGRNIVGNQVLLLHEIQPQLLSLSYPFHENLLASLLVAENASIFSWLLSL